MKLFCKYPKINFIHSFNFLSKIKLIYNYKTNYPFQKAGNYVAPDKKGDNMIRRVNEANKVDTWQKMQDNLEHYIKKFNLQDEDSIEIFQ